MRELRIGPKPPTKAAKRAKKAKLGTARARGVRRAKKGKRSCEICDWRPPFLARGRRSSGLHGHHIVSVADGGDCSETNVIVLCPNHHAIAHLIGDVVYTEAVAGGPTPRQRLVRWLRLADSHPDHCAEELKAHVRLNVF
jgi:hypothetical protein